MRVCMRGVNLRVCVCVSGCPSARASVWPFRKATASRYLETLLQSLRSLSDAVQAAAVNALRVLLQTRVDAGEAFETTQRFLLQPLEDSQQPLVVTARRGFVLALSALPPAVYRRSLLLLGTSARGGDASSSGPSSLLHFLLSEASTTAPLGIRSLEDAETRRNALVSLAFLIEALSPYSPDGKGLSEEAAEAAAAVDWRAVTDCLYTAASDFSADSRGDVGSWVRETAAEVSALILEAFPSCCLGARGAGPRAEERRRLLFLLLRAAFEGMTRTRSRAVFLLHRILAPRKRRVEQAHGGKGVSHGFNVRGHFFQERIKDGCSAPLTGLTGRPSASAREDVSLSAAQAKWIFDRIFREFAYELSPDQPPLDAYRADTSPASLSSRNSGVCLCAECSGAAATGDDAAESAFVRNGLFPFNPPELPLLREAVGELARLQWCQQKQTRPAEPFAGQDLSDATTAASAAAECVAFEKLDEQVHEKNVLEGGFAELHRTRRTAVAVRLPVFCCPYEVYRHFTPLLLVKDIADAVVDFAVLGIGGPAGSVTSLAQEAFVDSVQDLRLREEARVTRALDAGEEEEAWPPPVLRSLVKEIDSGGRAGSAALAVASYVVRSLQSSAAVPLFKNAACSSPGLFQLSRKKRDSCLSAAALVLQHSLLSASERESEEPLAALSGRGRVGRRNSRDRERATRALRVSAFSSQRG